MRIAVDEALARVRAAPRRFDAVITDQAMPRMSGLELVRGLHAVRAELPVIVHTGNVDAMPAFGDGVGRPSAVLQKPVEPCATAQRARAISAESDARRGLSDLRRGLGLAGSV